MRKALDYLLDRMGERSTWEGVAFIVTLTGSKWGANMDWGQAAGLGASISAAIKMGMKD